MLSPHSCSPCRTVIPLRVQPSRLHLSLPAPLFCPLSCPPAGQLQLKLLLFLKGKGGGGERKVEATPPRSESQWRVVRRDPCPEGRGGGEGRKRTRSYPRRRELKIGCRSLSGEARGDPGCDQDPMVLLLPLRVATGGLCP